MREPCSASSESAHAMSAARASRWARTSAERAIAAMNCVPLTSERPFLRPSRIGSSPTRAERLPARQPLAVEPGLALADERQREVRERREVAARADRAAARHVGRTPRFEALDEQLDHLDARARVALRERVRAQQHRGAHDLGRVRIADAARVAAKQPQLELLGQLLGMVCERSGRSRC